MKIKDVVKKVVTGMLENSITIVKADMVVEQVRKRENVEVTADQVKTVMKDELGLGYRMAKKVPVQANEMRCLVLRQQYAMVMLSLL